ncbi:hypothetical protein [Aquimarina sp. RZ0]|uniref:hypothetical protein n=1 Tax=Aquimarina sp. RZ0 TaxID=2607730 RepID=UPI0011F20BE3|nr:hypothetical protein [Aquimarina sp. RZ0]KAA1244851.1 hypothetical protein F0000_14705 [Aquimarina sp. RZ0]
MAPLKFEESIKEKLEQRAIQPSEGSWEKLEQELDHKEKKKKYKKYWFVGVAASLIGFLMITTFMTSTDEVIKSEQVDLVDTTKKINVEKEPLDSLEKIELTQTPLVQNKKKEEPVIENVIKGQHAIVVDAHLKIPEIIDSINDFKPMESIVSKTTSVDDNGMNEKAIDTSVLVNKMIIDNKLAGVIDKIKELKESDVLVTDEEIDKLLRNAQQEITQQEILKSNTVDALSLLLDVESELDETFKQRVFEALKTGFQKLKTSVVERDN